MLCLLVPVGLSYRDQKCLIELSDVITRVPQYFVDNVRQKLPNSKEWELNVTIDNRFKNWKDRQGKRKRRLVSKTVGFNVPSIFFSSCL